MGRRASVRYWESRGGYCCEMGGRQIVLATGPRDEPNGPCYEAALKAFFEVRTGQRTYSGRKTLGELWEKWLKLEAPKKSQGTVTIRTLYLADFCERFKDRRAEDLTPYEVEE